VYILGCRKRSKQTQTTQKLKNQKLKRECVRTNNEIGLRSFSKEVREQIDRVKKGGGGAPRVVLNIFSLRKPLAKPPLGVREREGENNTW